MIKTREELEERLREMKVKLPLDGGEVNMNISVNTFYDLRNKLIDDILELIADEGDCFKNDE